MVTFCGDAGSAVYNVFIGFDLASSTKPVETAVSASVRLDAWIVSVKDPVRKKMPQRPTPEGLLGYF